MPWIPGSRLTPMQRRAVTSAYPDHSADWYAERAFLFSRRGYLRTDDGALQVVAPVGTIAQWRLKRRQSTTAQCFA